ncbi:MAG: heavy-metal-associated domain-containing protein [Actinomycetota bacterium]
MSKEKLRVKGMHCGSCAMSIDEELEELGGVTEAKTSYRKQVTEVAFDENRVNIEEIQKTIRKLGYESTPA